MQRNGNDVPRSGLFEKSCCCSASERVALICIPCSPTKQSQRSGDMGQRRQLCAHRSDGWSVLAQVTASLCSGYRWLEGISMVWKRTKQQPAMFRMCLFKFSFRGYDSSDAQVQKLTFIELCKNSLKNWTFSGGLKLINLSISDNGAVTDNGVLFIAQNLALLRTLNIQRCKELTAQSLVHIAEHAHQLEVYYCDVRDQGEATEKAVKELSQKCKNITYLSMNISFILCMTTCTLSLLEGCPALHTLVVNEVKNILPTSRKLCAITRPTLKILVHNESTEYNVLTMPIWEMLHTTIPTRFCGK